MQNPYGIHVELLDFDELTPVSAYLRLRDIFPKSILLECCEYESRQPGYSYICCLPEAGIEVYDRELRIRLSNHSRSQRLAKTKVAAQIDAFLSSFTFSETTAPFCSGKFFGHFNYDAVQYFESVRLKNSLGKAILPDISLWLYRFMLVFDHAHNRLYLAECYSEYRNPESRKSFLAALRNRDQPHFDFDIEGQEYAYTSDSEFLNQIEQARGYCRDGEVFQLVLSRRYHQDFTGDDFNVYRALRRINPSPYLFYFDFGNYRLIGSSPETQLKVTEERAVLHPIAGTRFRSGSVSDPELTQELLSDPKENAEHVMLVDLARNDLNKSYSQVDVTRLKTIRCFSHVMHLESEVQGKCPIHTRFVQRLGETLPAGTLSGAPKYKAMQLIDFHEPVRRTYYGGCIGYVSPAGDLDMAIMIRSMLSIDTRLYYQAGAGIVEQSVAGNEFREVEVKLKALRVAIEQASGKSIIQTKTSPAL